MEEDKNFLRQDNNYRSLIAFQKAECIYDVTFYFAHRFLQRGDRTIDQMIQAARSGKQNLAEGNIDGITSREMGEMELMGEMGLMGGMGYPINPIRPINPILQ